MTITYKDKAQGNLGNIFSLSSISRKSLLSTTPIFIGAFTLLYIFAVWSLHYISYQDPTSYFFDAGRAYDRQYTTKRLKEAESLLQEVDQYTKPVQVPGHVPAICVGIATVARRGDQYVGLTVGSLLAGLGKAEREDIFLNLLIGHTVQSQHPIYAENWIENLPDQVLDYGNDTATIGMIRAWETDGWYRNKTIYDYTYLLRNCYDTGAEYVAMIEDDTLAVEGWYVKATEALRIVEANMKSQSRAKRWVYLRLFYADEFLGWNSEAWPKYLFWSFMAWASITGGMLWYKRRSRPHEPLVSPVVAFASCFCIPASIALWFMAGKQTVSPINAGVQEMNKYGCCSQAFVFPRAIIPDLLARTDLSTDWLVDMMIEKIADGEGWARWVVVPSLIQHIGATSSKGYGFDDSAKTLWNFRFEQSWH